MHSVDQALQEGLSGTQYDEVRRILYGGETKKLAVPAAAQSIAENLGAFDIDMYGIDALAEQKRPARTVRIGAVQNTIKAPTTATVGQQMEALYDFMEQAIQNYEEDGLIAITGKDEDQGIKATKGNYTDDEEPPELPPFRRMGENIGEDDLGPDPQGPLDDEDYDAK